MVRPPSYDSKTGLKKGAWSEDEDNKLRAHIHKYGHSNWRLVPIFAGLSRCGKSCRLRWVNYLKPGLRRGNFTKHEEDLIIRWHAQLGNKWSAIAAKLHRRTDNEVKNHWHAHLKKRFETTGNSASGAAAAAKIQPSEPHLSVRTTSSDHGYHHHQIEAGVISAENPDQIIEPKVDLTVGQAHQQWDLCSSWAAGDNHQPTINDILDPLPFWDQDLHDLGLVCPEFIMMNNDQLSNCSDYSSNYNNTGITSSAESQGSFSSDIFGDEGAFLDALLWEQFEQ